MYPPTHVSMHSSIPSSVYPTSRSSIHPYLSSYPPIHIHPFIHLLYIHSIFFPIPSFMFITPTFTYPHIHLSIYPSTSHPPTHTFIYLVVLRCLGLNSRPYAHHQIRSSTTQLHPRPRKVFFSWLLFSVTIQNNGSIRTYSSSVLPPPNKFYVINVCACMHICVCMCIYACLYVCVRPFTS